ncbi:aminoglycoside phosphotransferase [Shewanella algicola]|uniref:Aminoglycoside phosphotransferase family protein n=1 Tax=Shewanella algicola TaxID=640633 RepID=A0A9X2CAY6_9GAMM|nr:phosphotransferase [Shewanella algicola]MCL1105864.1 aminoglycoside phosphotransferase family protein [Shewanella algicola]GGP49933.1 aminoglycoside phosphotransferase [Shewanella algicola]
MSSPLLTLPYELINMLQQAIPAATYHSLLTQCTAVTLLNTGLSNQNYLLSFPSGDKVLRVNQRHSHWCNRALEVECWRSAIAANIAPKLEWVSDDKQFYLSEFITQPQGDWSLFSSMFGHSSTRPMTAMTHLNVDAVTLLAQLFASLSQLPVPSRSITVSAQWQQYAEQLAQYSTEQTQLHWQQAWQQLQRLNARVRHWLSQLESCVLLPMFCHRDLTPHNLLLSSSLSLQNNPGHIGQAKLYCIDYEYAVASHPLFDLASAIATHQLTNEQVNQLTHKVIVQYCQMASLTDVAAAKAALPAAINCFWLFSAMWALLMAAQDTEQSTQYIDYFNDYLGYISV